MFLALLLPIPTPDHLNSPPFLFVQCCSLTSWDPRHIDSIQLCYPTINGYFPMSLPLGFRNFFFHIWCPNYVSQQPSKVKNMCIFILPFIGKGTEAQKFKWLKWLDVQCSFFLMSHCLLSKEVSFLEPEGTSREISSCSEITKTQRRGSTLTKAIPVIFIISSHTQKPLYELPLCK